MKDFIYESSNGKKFNLFKGPYKLNVEPMFDYEWDYTKRERRRGDIIAGFTKRVTTKSIVLHIASYGEGIRNHAIDEFNSAIEADIYNATAGKIWYGDWFTYGYLVASKNEKWQYGVPVIKKTLTLAQEQDSWYRTTLKKSYENDHINVEPEEWCKTHADKYDYQYDYMIDFETRIDLINPDVLPSHFVLSIQGPADRPRVEIGDNVIEFNWELEDGDVLVVDSTTKTTIIYSADGTQTNVFGARNPDYYIFERMPSGRNSVSWNGPFTWEIRLIEERSEPRWHTA